jgi:hypothetical protein
MCELLHTRTKKEAQAQIDRPGGAAAPPGSSFISCVSAGAAELGGNCGVGQSVASGFSCPFHAMMIAAKPCA